VKPQIVATVGKEEENNLQSRLRRGWVQGLVFTDAYKREKGIANGGFHKTVEKNRQHREKRDEFRVGLVCLLNWRNLEWDDVI
jgi:hypothetical protein